MNKAQWKWFFNIPVNPAPKPEEIAKVEKIKKYLKVCFAAVVAYAVYRMAEALGLSTWGCLGVLAGVAFAYYVVKTM